MKNWGSLGVTNGLLLIIAVLLMVMVSNCPPSSKHVAPHSDLSRMGAAPSPTDSQMINPHTHGEDMGAEAPQTKGEGFNFSNMVFAALRCPSDATATLADIGCKGKDAETRRAFVGELAAQNLPPRMMFDKIIEKFGEKALSDEALEIRKNNRR